jgi:putative membrane protein
VLVRLGIRLVLVALVFGLSAHLVNGIHINGGFLSLLWIAVIFTLVNAIVGPILRLFSLPLVVLTLGLFLLIINAVLFAITAWLSSRLSVDSFGAALLGGIIVGFFSWLGEMFLPLRRHEHV